jgi:hypothetical protein
MDVRLSTQPDVFVWKPTPWGSFSIKSMYINYMDDHTRFIQKIHLENVVPFKIKICMWFLHRKLLVTKDNFAKRNWEGSK